MITVSSEYHVCDVYLSVITCGKETAYYFIEGHERTLFHKKSELAIALQKRADELFALTSQTKMDVSAYLKADWLEHWAKEFDTLDESVQKDGVDK